MNVTRTASALIVNVLIVMEFVRAYARRTSHAAGSPRHVGSRTARERDWNTAVAKSAHQRPTNSSMRNN